jgi:hypothetical protein
VAGPHRRHQRRRGGAPGGRRQRGGHGLRRSTRGGGAETTGATERRSAYSGLGCASRDRKRERGSCAPGSRAPTAPAAAPTPPPAPRRPAARRSARKERKGAPQQRTPAGAEGLRSCVARTSFAAAGVRFHTSRAASLRARGMGRASAPGVPAQGRWRAHAKQQNAACALTRRTQNERVSAARAAQGERGAHRSFANTWPSRCTACGQSCADRPPACAKHTRANTQASARQRFGPLAAAAFRRRGALVRAPPAPPRRTAAPAARTRRRRARPRPRPARRPSWLCWRGARTHTRRREHSTGEGGVQSEAAGALLRCAPFAARWTCAGVCPRVRSARCANTTTARGRPQRQRAPAAARINRIPPL